MIQGNCNCGAVRYEIDTELTDVYVCHCSICRRFSGAQGIAVVLVPNHQFRWLAGKEQVAMWKKPDADWESWFCRTCGSAMPGTNDSERMFVPAGSISIGGEQLRVAHHVWVDSRAPWDVIGDAGKRHKARFAPS
ncbi:GFA family protein [Pseudomarimonas arenosa]|uniref:GFA family protein n=1 Tax=Pseudomarimonas arenosa TaxID=2774145 RepID=A0AAW3ZEG6_9GAMM|nr:GFA family protein [Pseudomarimonas arenosa]MBD8524625.1 GFA family protein [Pseudomarimonas arenosa]